MEDVKLHVQLAGVDSIGGVDIQMTRCESTIWPGFSLPHDVVIRLNAVNAHFIYQLFERSRRAEY